MEEQRERKIEKEKQQTGTVPPGQTGGRRGEAAMQITMGMSATRLYLLRSECTRVQITTAAHENFEVM